MTKDISIVFTGHNIKWFATLAIESFLLLYPDLREKVVYFDDESTDGTREELERRKIRVVTWSRKWKKELERMKAGNHIKGLLPILPIRVSFIMKDLFEQIDTKYVFVSDGDVVFKEGGFLEEYFKSINEGYKIVSTKGHCFFDKKVKDNLMSNKLGELYKPFLLSTSLEHLENYSISDENKKECLKQNPYCTERVQFLQTLMDLEYFKSINLVGDTLTEDVIEVYDGCFMDTGSDFYFRLASQGIPVKWIDYPYLIKCIYHWCWLSSANRDYSEFLDKDYRNFEAQMEHILYEEGLGKIGKIVGVHPMRMIQSFKKTKGQSKLL